MTLIIAKRMRKWALFVAGIIMVSVVSLGMIYYFNDKQEQAKVDRSNAMQVAKSIIPEQSVPVASLDFFTEYRLERDKVRSERSDILREIVKNSKSDEARQRAQDSVLKMVLEKQRELEMENLIKSRGFSDVLVFLRDNSVSAIVKTNSLSREEVIQVADIISRVAGIKAEDITISAKP